jgi:single-strand DNA-binding protein
MNNLNSILIEGNIVRDPQFATTPQGTALCTFTIASDRFFKQDNGMEKEVSFFNVETYGKLADNVLRLGSKGRIVRIVGRIKQKCGFDSDGKALSSVVIVAERVEFRPEFPQERSEA